MVDATGSGRVAPGIDAARLRAIVAAYRDVLDRHRDDLNRLNVYPVPDGDTGTNMALTLESVVSEVEAVGPDLADVCAAVAHGSLMGARGNSGVILSQILRGLTDRVAADGGVSVGGLVDGLRVGSEAAYAAVMHPVEGTILTVAREAAAAAAAVGGADLVAVLDAAATAAHTAVARTPEQLPALAQAGVVDAGGRGLALFFDACLMVCDGRPVPEPAVTGGPTVSAGTGAPAGVSGPRFEVMFLLSAPDDAVPAFRAAWDALGESIVVVGGDGTWNCHVHTDDIGGAVEAGIVAGRPSRIEVTDLHDQVHAREVDWVAGAGGGTDAPTPDARSCAVVAVAVGDGAGALFTNLGVSVVVPGGQSMNPSTQQILDAVLASGGASVVVLPNNKNIVAVAEQAAALADRPVTVVPTRSMVEGIAAMIEFDADADATANGGSMGAEAARVRTVEITRAVRDTEADCGPVAAGDWIAVVPGGVCAATSTPLAALVAGLGRIVTVDDELCTVLVGAEADPADVDALRAHLATAHPDLEVEFHDGGQPLYPFLLGVE